MKWKIGFWLLLSIGFSSCTLGRFVFYNFADIQDHKKFPKRALEKSEAPFLFEVAKEEKSPKEITTPDRKIAFDDFLEENKTVAFMIIQDDTIVYERYFKRYDTASIVPSFSMAKSVTSMLIGCAIDDGLIDSVGQSVTDFIPEMKANGYDQVTIQHLLQMTSGMEFNESYVNPFGHAATFYYGLNLRRASQRLKLKEKPGTSFEYVSGSTQLLGLVLEKALNGKTITAYLQEKIWSPLQMEFDASWSIDKKKNGMEKTFCCLNARARDFAKLGRLYLNKGKWNGQQIVSEDWVRHSTKLDTSAGSAAYYQYQWWFPSDKINNKDFMAQGILGQYIYVNPEKNMIMVRLGKNYGKVNWGRFFVTIAAAYE
jgi:CubicO group peptidase (beta-lactamase class C family)